ncbi:MAG TPA: DinB family protein [Armatimonadota bacterium]
MDSLVRGYLLSGLQGTPELLRSLLRDLDADDPRWDETPDPDRFSIRGVLAHLADNLDVFAERIERILGEDHPRLPQWDPEAAATEGDYAHADPRACLSKLADGRAAIAARLKAVPESAWLRTGHRERMGDLTLEELMTLMLIHDANHLRQVAQWLEATALA